MLDADSEVVKRIGYTVLAAVGGLLGYVVRQQESKETFSWSKALVQTAGSGFVGLLVAMLCTAMGIEGLWLGPIVGVFGWMGAAATMDIVSKLSLGKLGLRTDKREEE